MRRCERCHRDLFNEEQLTQAYGLWQCDTCIEHPPFTEQPALPEPVEKPDLLSDEDVVSGGIQLVKGMLSALQLPPPQATFEVITSIPGRSVLLRLASGEIMLIIIEGNTLIMLARRIWGWKFPKRLFAANMWELTPDWAEQDELGKSQRCAIVLAGMMGIVSNCRSVAEVESVCLSGFENPADVAARVFEENAKLLRDL